MGSSDGSLDTGFSSDGKIIFSNSLISASASYATALVQQSDGKIVVAGYALIGSTYDGVLVRYDDEDGSLDTSFSSDGVVITQFTAYNDQIFAVIQDSDEDERLVVAGRSGSDFALARYAVSNGALDTTFDSDGMLTTSIGSGSDYANALVEQSDGKLVAAGYSYNGSNNDFAVVRYNTDGSPDLTFDGDSAMPGYPGNGEVTTAIGSGNDVAYGVVEQSNGKLVLGGSSHNGSNDDMALVRYNTDGSLDLTFDGDSAMPGYPGNGEVTTAIGSGNDLGMALVLLPNDKLVVGGYSSNGTYDDFAVLRYFP